MDSALSTQYPIHKIGSDGFAWWIGQIESEPDGNPKNAGRYRVRIVGVHLKDGNATKTEDLPWANVMMPVTLPFTDGGTTGGSIGLKVGNWVVGFFLDNDKQKPLIMGSIGHTPGATKTENVEEDPNPGSNCKEFTTFLDPNRDPYKHAPAPLEDKDNTAGATSTSTNQSGTIPGEAGPPAAATKYNAPPYFYALFAEASKANPTGKKVCVEVANPDCGSEKDLYRGLTNIIADMLKANQDAGGKLGSYYVSKFTGELNDVISIGREYINKAIKLVKTFIARIKGEIVKLLKDGVDKLVETLLYVDVATTDALGNVNTGPVNPDLGVKPFTKVTKKESRLKKIIDTINDVLEEVGCSMENLTERIADYISDLLIGYLLDAYQAAACLVDTVVNGIINEIINFIETELAAILGPLQDLLSIVSSPVDLIGGVIAEAFAILGISCGGPKADCEKTTKKCTDCDNGKSDDNWLDDLLDALEDGPLDTNSYICDEAKEVPTTPPTSISFVGGIPAALSTTFGNNLSNAIRNGTAPTTQLIQYTSEDISVTEGEDATFTITRSGDTTVTSSIRVQIISKTATENEDFQKTYEGSVIGFSRGQKTKTISFRTFVDAVKEGDERFSIRITTGVYPEGYVVNYPSGREFFCTITEKNAIPSVPDLDSNLPYIPGNTTLQTVDTTTVEPLPTIVPAVPRYRITSDQTEYYELETVNFFVQGENVNPGDSFTWNVDVDEEDIVGGVLSGQAVLDDNLQATISLNLADNNDNFRVDPAGTVPVLDEAGDPVLDEEGNIIFNEEDIITEFDDLDELMLFTIEETGDTASVTILGENTLQPAYFIRADKTGYDEGDTACFYIKTSNVPDGTELSYTLSGDVETFDIVGGQLTGTFTIQDSNAVICIDIAEDNITESSKIVTFSIDDTDASENIFLNPSVGLLVEDAIVTYSVSTDKIEYEEGEVVTFSITTTNVPDGTVLQWILYGQGIDSTDFVGGKLAGRVVIIDNKATVYASIAEDTLIEGREEVTFLLSGTPGFATFFIASELEEDVEVDPITELEPCLTKPVAGDVVTNDNGSIISIPILSQGCPYVEPPKVIIGGNGSGASGIALLDDTGRVSEIRVTRVGVGYKRNTRSEQNLKCIIDSFTMITPGKGYKEAPKVFVDGRSDIARAVIDENGFVISVQVTDRSYEVNGLPSIVIQGGGGSGARFLPSIACLDTLDNLAASGFAKIGTGKYIDCP